MDWRSDSERRQDNERKQYEMETQRRICPWCQYEGRGDYYYQHNCKRVEE
jgi:hypothetical protein